MTTSLDEQARKARAAALRKQIDALKKGDVSPAQNPRAFTEDAARQASSAKVRRQNPPRK